MPNVETITKNGKIIAIVVRKNGSKNPLDFITPDDFPLQVGVHNKKRGDVAKPHEHKPFVGLNIPCQEFFYIKKGKVNVSLYDEGEKCDEVVISEGEFVVLNCGHGVDFLDDTELIEVKQGPYRGKAGEKSFLG